MFNIVSKPNLIGLEFQFHVIEWEVSALQELAMENQVFNRFLNAMNLKLGNLVLRALLSRAWEVKLDHCYREANQVADGLANMAVDSNLNKHVLLDPPREIRHLLASDFHGIAWPRMVGAGLS
ncbi:hypothetical protein GH714_015105 [Hevea brasiliensis]|uniref:RNase H type-1 domain-containing protein n=1 Tax=Hevea brasiliensis TaxID=3981 RepID=A0A6A6NHA6_HEVBR|nr:hypothetical protein GH714_015105 [Hevea brasiliensis]